MIITSRLIENVVLPGGCTDARRSVIIRTSTGFRCNSCGWSLPYDQEAARTTHFYTSDNGSIEVEVALQFYHVLDPKGKGYYFTCPEHTSKAYKTLSQVADHIYKHHTAYEFQQALKA